MLAARFTNSHSSLDFWSFLSMSGHTRDMMSVVVVVVVVFLLSLSALSLSVGFALFLVRSLSLSVRGVRSVGLVQYIDWGSGSCSIKSTHHQSTATSHPSVSSFVRSLLSTVVASRIGTGLGSMATDQFIPLPLSHQHLLVHREEWLKPQNY
jgi:hypothetical protein